MIAEKELVEEENKSLDRDYVSCDQCEWNGVSNQKVVRVYLGLRPTNGSGFIHEFFEFDYPTGKRQKLHKHKYKKGIIDQLVVRFSAELGGLYNDSGKRTGDHSNHYSN